MENFWTDCELIPELTSSQCNWKGNQKGKGTDETPPSLVLPDRIWFPANLGLMLA